jgi:hypothetical protein
MKKATNTHHFTAESPASGTLSAHLEMKHLIVESRSGDSTRKVIRKIVATVALMIFHWSFGYSQNATIQEVEINDGKVVVHYDLETANANQKFQISLLSSYDKFIKPLNFVKGDVGVDLGAGKDKKIVWDITKELANYKGNLTFEVRGRVYVPFVRITQFEEGKVYKRGKGYPITWTSGNKSGNVDIEIINKDQESVHGDNNLPNTGHYQLFIPGSTKKGTYTLRFTNVKDRSDVVVSPPFEIKPKVPGVMKVLGIAILGGGVAAAASLGGGSGPSGVIELTSFDDYPKNPDGN